MIGLFDSGLGGLTVLRRVREALPQHDMLFFADQAHVPYGDRSVPDLLDLVRQNLNRLEEARVDVIVMACNTSCAMGNRFGWPATRAPVLDLIESAAIGAQRGGYRRIGVIATTATARSGAYARQIVARMPETRVHEVAAPALAPLVEAGLLDGPQTRAAVAQVCAPLAGRVDAVLLGCTHYPLLHEHFAAVLGPGIAILDPALVHAERAAELARQLAIAPGSGRLICVSNGDMRTFAGSLDALLAGVPHEIIASDFQRA